MNRSLRATAAAALVCAALAACATATPYQPRIEGAHVGGYSEQRLDGTHWRVRFSGNSLTARDTVESYLLYRAAELTLQQGGDWFEASNKDVERRMRFYVQSDPLKERGIVPDRDGGWNPQWRYHRSPEGWRTWDRQRDASFWTDASEQREVDRYIATVEISIGRGPAPENREVYDARRVKADLEPGIVRPTAPGN